MEKNEQNCFNSHMTKLDTEKFKSKTTRNKYRNIIVYKSVYNIQLFFNITETHKLYLKCSIY